MQTTGNTAMVGGNGGGAGDGEEPTNLPGGLKQRGFVPPPGATRITLIRHGQTQPAHADRTFPLIDGQGNPELTDLGRRQAERVADRFGETDFDVIIVTNMIRTQQTAAPLAARLGLQPVEDADLREVHLGEWEGGRFRVEAAAGNALFSEIYATGRYDVIPGAEAHEAFVERILAGYQRALHAHRGGHVALVVHGGVIGALLAAITGAPRRTFFAPDNCSVSEIVELEDSALLRSFNIVDHLKGLPAH